MKKYLNILLSAGVIFGALMGIFDALTGVNLSTAALGGLVQGLVFGSAIALFAFFADKRAQARGIDTDSAAVDQSRTVTLHGSVDEIAPRVEAALLSLHKAKIIASPADQIVAKTGVSWKSFGETITVSLVEESPGQVLVTINSRSSLRTTAVDYGRNAENVQLIQRQLETPRGSGEH